jgi:nitroimidazol reductase NimA-like FMN-containing flavoprotein (pyridoxamine 5'-phosphate oxidase superfamily)
MTDQEVGAFLDECTRAYVTTNGTNGWPHVVPLSYILLDGQVAFWTDGTSRKVRNLRADDRMSCLMEHGDDVGNFRAVQLSGRAEIIDDHQTSTDVGARLFARYSEAPLDPRTEAYATALARQRVVIRMHAEWTVSWDHRKVMVDLGAMGS